MKADKLDYLTSLQVDALRECIDFTHNGYYILIFYVASDYMFIKMRHLKHERWLKMYVYPWRYDIYKNGVLVKSVSRSPDSKRFDVLLDSGVQIKRTYTEINGCEKLVFGSVLPNNNDR